MKFLVQVESNHMTSVLTAGRYKRPNHTIQRLVRNCNWSLKNESKRRVRDCRSAKSFYIYMNSSVFMQMVKLIIYFTDAFVFHGDDQSLLQGDKASLSIKWITVEADFIIPIAHSLYISEQSSSTSSHCMIIKERFRGYGRCKLVLLRSLGNRVCAVVIWFGLKKNIQGYGHRLIYLPGYWGFTGEERLTSGTNTQFEWSSFQFRWNSNEDDRDLQTQWLILLLVVELRSIFYISIASKKNTFIYTICQVLNKPLCFST